MGLKESLKEYKEKVDSLLAEYFQEDNKALRDFPVKNPLIYPSLRDFTIQGGKRLRPAIMYNTYRLFSDQNLPEVQKLSIFIELIQSFLLIHDDIMDNADLRRGNPTIHKVFEEYAIKSGYTNPEHYGRTMAILVGDLACQMAYNHIERSPFPSEIKTKVIGIVSHAIAEVIYGQVNDVELSYLKNYKEEDVLSVHRYKTAVYTFKLPAMVGAVLAGADSQALKQLDDYSLPCGIAFQIQDDILGVFGEDEKTGKTASSDIIENKKTLLVHYAYENASSEQKEVLNNALGNRDVTEEQLNEVKKVLRETGSLAYSVNVGRKYIEEGKEALAGVDSEDPVATAFLRDLADYLLVRES